MKKKIDIEIIDKKQIPQSEPERQYYFMDIAKNYVEQLSAKKGSPLTFHVTTFGCQMNARDSEKLVGILERIGYVETDTEDADFVIYNTCTVRENANNKVYGRLGVLQNYKKKNPHMLIGLCGCMMQETVVVEKLKESYRFVDLIFGTHNIYKFAELIVTAMESDSMTIDIWKDTDQIVEDLPVERKYSFKSGVNIMFGCNNFCSYCIVPYVRGRERSREADAIVREAEELYATGVKEIMLLGQNVNSYGKGLEGGMSFARLLRRLDQIGIPRIRFMTSHPKDLSQELIDAMGECAHVCPQFHLPVQSGNDEILRAMNRHYDRAAYLDKVERLRQAVPGIGLTTDIIVGFPGETEAQFQDTLSLVKQVGYDSAFTFIFSPRPGTKAASMPDQVPADVAQDRLERLLQAQEEAQLQAQRRFLGTEEEVLVESLSRRSAQAVSGKGMHGISVTFPGSAEDVGQIIRVKITECANNTLRGVRLDKEKE